MNATATRSVTATTTLTPELQISEGDLARFWAKVLIDPSGCLIWAASKRPNGYGWFSFAGKPGYAHRFAYEALVGPIADGLVIDHLCRVRACVNPRHLEPVTNRVNILRGETIAAQNAAKTHCDNGHAFDEANTYRRRGKRHCRACNRDRMRARKLAARAAAKQSLAGGAA